MTDFAAFQVIIFYVSVFLLPLKQKIIMDPIFLRPQIPFQHNMPQHGLPVKNGRGYYRLFFHRFRGFENNRISETLSLGEKSLSLEKNPFIFMGEIWNFP